MKNDKFKFYVPCDIEKSAGEAGTDVMIVKGIASTADKDSQGEFLDPSGFDLSGFKWINWNHKGTVDPSTIIGEPTKASITPGNQLYIEGLLYPEVAKARETWNLMKALQNSPGGNKLCLSVEGKVTQRASNDKKNPLYNRILKSKITGVAICPVPINGNTWVDLLQKGYTENEEEEYDDDTKKAMTAAAGEDTTSKESVETAGGKKPLKSLEGTQTKVFKKSDIFEKIYDQFPEVDIEKAKSVYSLIEKIATMSKEKTITEETITKAFDILNLASEDIVKGEDAKVAAKKKEDEDKEKDEEKEKVEKAKGTYNVMKGEGIDNDIIKSALVKKGYSEEIITKAMTEEVAQTTKVGEGLSKSEVEDIVKAQVGSAIGVVTQKLEAVTTILTKQVETNQELKKSFDAVTEENDALKKQVEEYLKVPAGRKSQIITKSYSDKFEKSEDGQKGNGRKFNLKDKTDRNALRLHVMELSGINDVNKGESFDRNLVRIAQDIELTGMLSKSEDITLLQSKGLELVVE